MDERNGLLPLAFAESRGRRFGAWQALLTATFLVFGIGDANGSDEIAAHAPVVENAESTQNTEESQPDATPGQRLKVTIGLYLLFGVAALGGALIALVIWWGGWVKRTLRKPLPSADRGDELWFLRGGPSPREADPDGTEGVNPDEDNDEDVA